MLIGIFMLTWFVSLATIVIAGFDSNTNTIQAENTTLVETKIESNEWNAIGAGLSVGLAGIGSALGMGSVGASAMGALTENEALFGRAIVFLIFIEAIAIYGLLVSILIILLL